MSKMNPEVKEEHTWSETIEVAGDQLVAKVKELVDEGRVQRLIIRRPNDEVLLEIPLAAGIAVGGVMTLFAPVLAAIGAIAALIADFHVEVVHVHEEDETQAQIEESAVEHEKEFA